MIIGIDANEANVKNRVGIGQYAFHILKNIEKLDKHNQYITYLKNKPQKDLPKTRKNWRYQVFGPNKLWTKIALPLRLYSSKPKPDVLLSLSHYSPFLSPCPTIPTIMDLGYLKYSDQFTKKDLYQLTSWTKQSIKKACHIITISKFSKDEIVKTYKINPDKITIAPPASIPPKKITNTKKTLKKFNIDTHFFLYLGTLKPSKNIPFLIKSFATFSQTNSKYKLVIAGKKGWLFDDIYQTVKKLKIENKVIFTDFVSETEKWHLYKQTQALIIPSSYEGFGMPALEAMSVGTPVISSNITSLPEVVGDSGILVDPHKPKELTQALQKIINPGVRKKLSQKSLSQSKKFSWQKSAQTIIRTLQEF